MVGTDLLKCTQRLFHDWHRVRDGTLTRRGFHSLMVALKRDVRTHLEEGSGCADQGTRATCDELLRYFDDIWQFATSEDVEPTNNAAERSLRHAVIWKHLSFGTQSDHGSRFVERLLTVIETCRQQSRNPFAFLIDSLTAHLTTKPAPTLLDGV